MKYADGAGYRIVLENSERRSERLKRGLNE